MSTKNSTEGPVVLVFVLLECLRTSPFALCCGKRVAARRSTCCIQLRPLSPLFFYHYMDSNCFLGSMAWRIQK